MEAKYQIISKISERAFRDTYNLMRQVTGLTLTIKTEANQFLNDPQIILECYATILSMDLVYNSRSNFDVTLMETLLKFFSSCPSLKCIKISRNYISQIPLPQFAHYPQFLRQSFFINFSNCIVKNFLSLSQDFPSLLLLDLSHNSIESIEHLYRLVSRTKLRLILVGNFITHFSDRWSCLYEHNEQRMLIHHHLNYNFVSDVYKMRQETIKNIFVKPNTNPFIPSYMISCNRKDLIATLEYDCHKTSSSARLYVNKPCTDKTRQNLIHYMTKEFRAYELLQ